MDDICESFLLSRHHLYSWPMWKHVLPIIALQGGLLLSLFTGEKTTFHLSTGIDPKLLSLLSKLQSQDSNSHLSNSKIYSMHLSYPRGRCWGSRAERLSLQWEVIKAWSRWRWGDARCGRQGRRGMNGTGCWLKGPWDISLCSSLCVSNRNIEPGVSPPLKGLPL